MRFAEIARQNLLRSPDADQVLEFMRSCVMLLRHAEQSIRSSAGRSPAFVRPANNDEPGLAIFEHRLAQILLVAFKEVQGLD
jgi:hypothetical protein